MIESNNYNPQKFSKSKQWLIALLLLIFMVISRSGYFLSIEDASWSIFFLLGFYLRNFWGLPLLLLIVMATDFLQIAARGGHQDFYLAPSYLFIIPAYACLWFAGRYFANRYDENFLALATYFISAVVGIILCHLISSGGYYWMSLEVIDLNYQELISRTLEFLPIALKINLFYLSIAAVIHIVIVSTMRPLHERNDG